MILIEAPAYNGKNFQLWKKRRRTIDRQSLVFHVLNQKTIRLVFKRKEKQTERAYLNMSDWMTSCQNLPTIHRIAEARAHEKVYLKDASYWKDRKLLFGFNREAQNCGREKLSVSFFLFLDLFFSSLDLFVTNNILISIQPSNRPHWRGNKKSYNSGNSSYFFPLPVSVSSSHTSIFFSIITRQPVLIKVNTLDQSLKKRITTTNIFFLLLVCFLLIFLFSSFFILLCCLWSVFDRSHTQIQNKRKTDYNWTPSLSCFRCLRGGFHRCCCWCLLNAFFSMFAFGSQFRSWTTIQNTFTITI